MTGAYAVLALAVALGGQTTHAAGPDWGEAEREFLARTPQLRVCADPAYEPFDFIDADGRHRGIAADLLAEISRIIGVPMRVVPSADWAETLRLARAGECDLVAMLNESPARAAYLAFTRPYVTFENVIVTHRPAYHRGLASLAGRTLALPRDYRMVELVDSLHPGIEVILVESADAALRAVSSGKAYATLVNQQRLVSHVQRLRLPNIHFAGNAELEDQYRIGVVRSGDGLLLVGILDRALGELTAADISRIMERWYVVPVEPTLDLRALITVAAIALTVIAFLLLHLYHRSRYYRLVDRQNQDLERLSSTDPLTGAANRRALDARLAEEVERARRHRRDLAIILFDLDRFKDVNDRYGHQAGDDILVELVGLAESRQRITDVLGRWGGDEFLIICSETGLAEARLVADRLREAVASHLGQADLRLALSIGVAGFEEGDTPASLLQRADQALYRAKASGGDRVEAGVGLGHPTPAA